MTIAGTATGLQAAWRSIMRVWTITHDVGRVAEALAALPAEHREALLAGPECDSLRADVESLLRARHQPRQPALL